MAIVVIGGHSRSVGKTSVVAGLIGALREFEWTAVKITQYGHGVCSANGQACDCATADHAWAVSEEKDRSGRSDTSRFLLAGAARVLWVRTEQGRLAEAMPALRRRLQSSRHLILESNSVMKFIRPDLYMTVLDPENEDFKKSAQEFLDRAHAMILRGSAPSGVASQGFSRPEVSRPEVSRPEVSRSGVSWSGVSLKPVAERPVFRIVPPNYVTPEIVEYVRGRVTGARAADWPPVFQTG